MKEDLSFHMFSTSARWSLCDHIGTHAFSNRGDSCNPKLILSLGCQVFNFNPVDIRGSAVLRVTSSVMSNCSEKKDTVQSICTIL